jgi:bifunctional non-homologous end joining protein LigD
MHYSNAVRIRGVILKNRALKEYESKRRFDKTTEPEPRRRREGSRLIFVVHKHAARALHYDLRLELEGVLKSWAVPKGPAMNPSIKRLAVMVEDHPFDYKDFEGIIPKGNYGAGSVIIWDRGFYHHPSANNRKESEKLLLEGLRKGDIKFVLEGKKLKGEFALVKTGKDERSWLLLKKKDRYASEEDILVENRSVVSMKTLEDISESGQKRSSGQELRRSLLRKVMERIDLKDAPARPMPHGIRPMLATLIKEPFDHPDWIFEVKWDGYRAVAEIRGKEVSLYSRKGILLNKKFSSVADSLRKCGYRAVLDGEIVVVDDLGRPDFQMLQNYQKTRKGHLLYYVFDLLYLEGRDLTALPLIVRKEILKTTLPSDPKIRFSDHVSKEGVLFFNTVKRKGLEGIVAKHSQSRYRMDKRSRQWLKVKTHLTQECVIAGFTKPRGSRRYFGSLVLGIYMGRELVYVGHSGGGFAMKALKEIRERLDLLARDKCPFREVPKGDTQVTWVRPEVVCEVLFRGWTDEGVMRQPVFLRLRDDKAAREVVREEPFEGP